MKVRINGEDREIDAGTTLEGLLNALGIRLQGVAVEVNREIVPKRSLGSVTLSEGDSVEIVRMVGGG